MADQNKTNPLTSHDDAALSAPLPFLDDDDPNRKLEAAAREDMRKRDALAQERRTTRSGDYPGSGVVTTKGLRDTNPDATYVAARHSDSGEFEVRGKKAKAPATSTAKG